MSNVLEIKVVIEASPTLAAILSGIVGAVSAGDDNGADAEVSAAGATPNKRGRKPKAAAEGPALLPTNGAAAPTAGGFPGGLPTNGAAAPTAGGFPGGLPAAAPVAAPASTPLAAPTPAAPAAVAVDPKVKEAARTQAMNFIQAGGDQAGQDVRRTQIKAILAAAPFGTDSLTNLNESLVPHFQVQLNALIASAQQTSI